MDIHISFTFDNGTHHQIVEKAKKQIGNPPINTKEKTWRVPPKYMVTSPGNGKTALMYAALGEVR